MAEQFPEEGGKIPWLGLEDGKQTGLPGHSPAPSGEMQRSRPLPPSPDRTGVSLGIFAFPLPKPRSTFPWHPHSQQSLLSFPSGTPVSLVTAPAVPHPPSPKPPSPAAAPDSHLPLGTLSIHSRHRRCHSATRCPQPWPKAAWDPCPGVPQSWHPRALVLGTRGVPLRALPGSRGGSGSSLRHTRCPWAAGGGGRRSLWGHCEAGAGHQAWQRPDCGGRGPSHCHSSPRPRGCDDPGGSLCGSGGQQPRAGALRRRPALPPSCLPVRGAPARSGPRLPGLAASGSRYMVPSSPAPSGLLRAARGRALLRRRCRTWGRATPGGGSEGGGRAGCTEPRSRGAGAARQPSRPPAEHAAAAAAAEPRRASSLRPARRVCAPERV